ncbi:hypothetical protein C4544_01890 [candidate division WS5 bacterium]|uniref:Uncharacterized protein n=1 Tax=candidate division WS5 bacterium TaxID=2093353 RepID=A0A419DF77_9BACT|nr:MAG: hypothetical protein C4544_01890 [candidate division WS5 bacterium]
MKKTRKTYKKCVIECAGMINELPKGYQRMTADEIMDSISVKGRLIIARSLCNDIYPEIDWKAVEKWLADQFMKDIEKDEYFVACRCVKKMKLDDELTPVAANLAYALRDYLLSKMAS